MWLIVNQGFLFQTGIYPDNRERDIEPVFASRTQVETANWLSIIDQPIS
jgi:hypothetical protein